MSPITGNGVGVMDPYNETLAQLPPAQRKRTSGDGTEPDGSAGRAPAQDPSADQQQPQVATLLDASDGDAFRTIDQLTKSQDRLRRNRWAIDTYHGWLDDNIQFSYLDKVPNQNVWRARLAPGVSVERSASVPNKAADLCNKVTDALLADPPKPNPQPHVDDESVDAAADLAAEVLRQNAGEAGINEIQQYRWALRNSLTRSTSYLEFDINEDGGGYQPYQVLAHPQATDPNKPMVAVDPATNLAIPAVDPVLRYVSQGGQFVDDASQADRVWLPKIVVRRHQRVKVTVIPATATLEDADMVILSDYCTLSEARSRWPETVGAMASAELNQLTQWRPSFWEMLVPFTFRNTSEGMTGPSFEEVGAFSPLLQKRMYFHRCFIKKSRDYPDGLTIDVTGQGQRDGLRLGQQTMEYDVNLPTGGTEIRCRDIPLTAVTPDQDVAGMDPSGWPFEARFDSSAKADANQLSQYLDALERMANPHVFIRSNTAIEEDEWADRSKPIVVGPSDQMPTYEQFPPLPPVVQFSEYLQTRQDTASGLTATAQGLDSENSQSGIAKKLTVRQAQISLAGIQQQLHAAMTRGWRICCQWVQAKYTIPQLIKFSGEDASNQEQWWTGADFAGIDTIGIEPGTGTFMTAEDKANYIAFLQGQGWLDAEKAGEIGITGIARDLGLPSNPIKAFMERAVGVWLKGAPDGWVQEWQTYEQEKQAYDLAQQQFQHATQLYTQYLTYQAVVNAGPPSGMLGPEGQAEKAGTDYASAAIQLQVLLAQNPTASQPPQPPQVQPPQKPWTPFGDRPCDTEPEIAKGWTERLRMLQMSPRYSAQPKEWQQCADEKYMTSRQAWAMATGAAPSNPMAGHSHQRSASASIGAAGVANGPPNSQPQAA